ncbi:uncharacterized protein DEA37_0014799 [Paragonimus westermani]|uniref:Ig-like domain-containing protein n=1 Tax=Paragonimus westermani TaxID=34504 RepID=A0A5J4NGS8_9TREM|nr:uncharacterized protein DEA37_0014799 [Paragonimus westermani]
MGMCNMTERFSYIVAHFLCCLVYATLANNTCPDAMGARSSWLVLSENIKDVISLTCQSPDFYPFCNLTNAKNIVWRLPQALLSLTLKPGQEISGWKVSPTGYELQINRKKIAAGTPIAGIYECLVLSVDPKNDSLISWRSLQWALDTFASERTLIEGSFGKRYARNIMAAVLAVVSLLLAFTVIKLISYFSYKARKLRDEEYYEACSPVQVQMTRYNAADSRVGLNDGRVSKF